MKEQIEQIKQRAKEDILKADASQNLEQVRVKHSAFYLNSMA